MTQTNLSADLSLGEEPEERARLQADASLMETAVDEIVRYVSPVLSLCRTVTEDHDLCGRTLHEGDKVLTLYQSTNRDETVFDEPHRFRIDRRPNPRLGFGIGTHFCLGANLAKTEIAVVFDELFRPLPDIRVPEGAGPTRGYVALLDEALTEAVSFDQALPAEERLVAFLAFLSAAATVTELLVAIDGAMARWLSEGFADLAIDPARTGRTVRHLIVSRLVEVLATPGPASTSDDEWAREVAPILLGR